MARLVHGGGVRVGSGALLLLLLLLQDILLLLRRRLSILLLLLLRRGWRAARTQLAVRHVWRATVRVLLLRGLHVLRRQLHVLRLRRLRRLLLRVRGAAARVRRVTLVAAVRVTAATSLQLLLRRGLLVLLHLRRRLLHLRLHLLHGRRHRVARGGRRVVPGVLAGVAALRGILGVLRLVALRRRTRCRLLVVTTVTALRLPLLLLLLLLLLRHGGRQHRAWRVAAGAVT
jgi:hypothetical protein